MHQLAQPASAAGCVSTGLDRPSISLVLPAWNEADAILPALDEAITALSQLTDDYEVIVVDDGSSDGTADLVKQVAQYNAAIRLVQHDRNLGYGAALRNGFSVAKCDLVAFTDADCQFDLNELDRFVLLSRKYDIVCGYRIDRQDTPLRCLYSRVYNQLVRIMLATGVRDVDCALKMFHREVVQQLTISTDGFLVNLELLNEARRRNHSVVEVGVSHRPRTAGTSTVSIHHIPKVLGSLVRYWWNKTQFTAIGSVVSVDAKANRFDWRHVALILMAIVFLFSNLGYPLIDRDETRYAEIPREMLVTGNWVLPQLNFETYYDKPPLAYWLCAISYSLFGVSEWSARLVPALAALGTLLAILWFGGRHFGKRVGLIAAGVLMLSVGFVFTSRYLLIDGVMSLFVTLSLLASYEAIKPTDSSNAKPALGWWMIASICCGLGFLTKGPLSLVLLLPTLYAFASLSDGYSKPRPWHYALMLLTVVGISAPWMIAVTLQDENFLSEFFYRHNIQRFSGEFHAKPFWYFVPVLLIAGHPWSFLTIPYTRFLFTRNPDTQAKRPIILGFLMLWSGWCFVFFSLSQCKLPTYLLPAAPALALLIGHYFDNAVVRSAQQRGEWFASFWSARMATATTCLAGVASVAFIMVFTADYSLLNYLWCLFWFSLLICTLLMIGDRHQADLAWASSAVLMFLLAAMVMHQMIPAYSRQQTILGPNSPLTVEMQVADQSAIATVAHEFAEVPFYLGRSDIAHFDVNAADGLSEFVSRNGHALIVLERTMLLGQLQDQLPSGTRMQLIGQRGPATLLHVTAPATQVAQRSSGPSLD